MQFLLFLFFTSILYSSENIYFASYEEKVVGKKLKSNSLNFQPVKKALTAKKFKEYNWRLSLNKKINQNHAIDSAVKAFLLKNGNLRIKTRSVKSGSKLYDETRSFYEGYFKNKIKIIDIKESKKTGRFDFYFRADFTPLAQPDKWGKILLKDKFISYYSYIKSFFIYE